MCGRYHFGILDNPKGKKIRDRAQKLNLTYKEGEIFPKDKVLVLMPVGSSLDLATKTWGMNLNHFQINARIESIKDKNFYNKFKNNRCAVLANGFYEWDNEKRKYYIDFKDYYYLACIYDNDELLIITKEARDSFKKIHDREPLVLDETEVKAYLANKDFNESFKEFDIKPLDTEIKLF